MFQNDLGKKKRLLVFADKDQKYIVGKLAASAVAYRDGNLSITHSITERTKLETKIFSLKIYNNNSCI